MGRNFRVFGLALLSAGLFSFASAASPPLRIERDAYRGWLEEIGSVVSPFHDHAFDWLERELDAPLPGEAYSDPKGAYIVVQGALSQTIELEEMGEIEQGITYGFEGYLRVPHPVSAALEAQLFRWGKPVGKAEGSTYPNDTVFGYRRETIERRWGEGSYYTTTVKRNGGLVKEQNDAFSLLVRELPGGGAVLVGNFHAPSGSTTTRASLFLMSMRPIDEASTAVKIFSRYQGQSYALFGLEFGRKNFGFNADRFRNGQLDYLQSVDELVRTGTIRERPEGT
ncbi:MAG: hypothetical protein HUU37_00705 [Bdellovibrionales bacterium]|nr:hypothetical protein [Bdellovibrionales bacterium]